MPKDKEQVWLFHSIQLEDLSNTNDLRYKLLDHFLNYKRVDAWRNDIIPVPNNKKEKKCPDEFRSWFEVDVYNDIVSNGYKSIPNYKVLKGRYEIDLVPVLKNGTKIAIECDGDFYHGQEQYLNDLMRQKVLERCGWQFFRVRGAEYYSNRKKALEPLWELLYSNDKPIIINNCLQNGMEKDNIHNKVQKEELDKKLCVESQQDFNFSLEVKTIFSKPKIYRNWFDVIKESYQEFGDSLGYEEFLAIVAKKNGYQRLGSRVRKEIVNAIRKLEHKGFITKYGFRNRN